METAEQATARLHKNVKPPLEQMGHQQVDTVPAAEKPVPLEDLKQFGIDTKQYGEALVQDALGGVTSHSRETKSKNPLHILKEKIKEKLSKRPTTINVQDTTAGRIVALPNRQEPLKRAA